MTELIHYQPGKAFYDSFQGARGNTLAKLAITGEGEQRKSALADLYGLDPSLASQAQAQIGKNDEQDYSELVQSAKVMYSLKGRPEADMMWQRVAPKFSQKYGIQFNPTPQPSDWDAIEQIVRATEAQGQNTGVQSTFISGGKLNYLTRDGRAVDTGKAVDDTYKEIIDPVTGQVSGYAKRGNYLAPAGTSAMPQVQQGADPMAGGLDRINQGAQVLKANGVPVDKINEWADSEFAKLQGGVQGGVVEQAPSQARVNVKPTESKGYTRVMTPQEVAAAGLPQGTSAQVNEATGAISVLNKPMPTPTKQANADVVKQAAQLPSLLRRVDRVAQASEKLGIPGADGGPVDQYALKLSESGQELESAVGQLRSMLMPFVRVPGVGSQSDLEARLDGLQYPDASQPPAVRARNIAELQKFIADLSRAYSSTIKGEPGGQAPVQVRNADDYNRLPPGTQYIDPTGKQRVKK
jgi:hypothetical protein